MLTWIFTDLIVQCRTLRSKKSLFPYINSGGYYLRSVIIPLDRVRFVCCPLELASTFFFFFEWRGEAYCVQHCVRSRFLKYNFFQKEKRKSDLHRLRYFMATLLLAALWRFMRTLEGWLYVKRITSSWIQYNRYIKKDRGERERQFRERRWNSLDCDNVKRKRN